MFTRNDIIKQLQLIKQALQEKDVVVEGLWLFGSYAKGTPHAYSDIDIAIISSTFKENPFENIQYIQNIPRLPQMEFHFYRPCDIEEDPFLLEIKKYAIAV